MGKFQQGYTLLELLVVLALIVLIAALAYPSLDGLYESRRLTAGADQVRTAWASARSHAMDEGQPYQFAVALNKGNFRVAPDTADQWPGASASATPADPSNPAFVLQGALPKGVRFVTVDSIHGSDSSLDDDTVLPTDNIDPSVWSRTVVFLPDGTARRCGNSGAGPLGHAAGAEAAVVDGNHDGEAVPGR